MIHSLPCTVSNEMETNQFYEPLPCFPTDVEPCHSLPLCLLEFLRGTINHFNQRVHYNELIHIPSYQKQKTPKKKIFFFFFKACPINHNHNTITGSGKVFRLTKTRPINHNNQHLFVFFLTSIIVTGIQMVHPRIPCIYHVFQVQCSQPRQPKAETKKKKNNNKMFYLP